MDETPHHPQNGMFYVYLLRSRKDGKCYIGVTNDLNRRVSQHNQGLSHWTKSRTPLELVYYEAYRSWQDAQVRERRLKQFKRGFSELKKRTVHSIEVLEKGGGG